MTTEPVFSSPSCSSFTHDSWTYDVFLSFRGEDTRTTFADHLYNALSASSIYTFIDRELKRGEEISPALVRAIEESRISLIVFSENYASSRWCLDELVKILQCKEPKQQIVLPIFYKVDPSDVRNQTNSFGDAFADHHCRFKDNMEKVLGWGKALRQAANLSGHTFKDGEYEATFINNIVDRILMQVLRCTYWNVAKYPVGIQSCVQDVEMLLNVGGNGRRIVGIWGPSGIGKTTIAKAIWNASAYKFEGSCFLENVRENSMRHGGGLIQLQEALLHEILGINLKIQSVDQGIGFIKARLRHKKILLILDDVNELVQLDNLAGVGWFGEGSRVITTTQDNGLLKCHGIDLIYEVQKLCGDRALELFSFSAFGANKPPTDYLELAQRALAYAQGLPLALTLLGSYLRNKGIHRWQAILDGYKGEPYTGIQKILQKSYDALENSVQQVFLDIACFFKGENKDYVLQIVSNSKNKVSRDCIEVLIEKAMITINHGRIWMHDLLENLGKDIVHKESPIYPGERSRLWSPEDVSRVLTENSGTGKLKGIMLKFCKPDEIHLNSKSFSGMVNLEIFINCNVVLSGEVEYLPNELRLIDWGYRCQLQSLPSGFHPVHLAEFNMSWGGIRRLEKLKNMLKLTSMDLSHCKFLEKIPDLSGIPNIKYLDLSECTSLVEVDDSVGRLDKLVQLKLDGCVRLTRFATRLRLKSLEWLDLTNCERLESFPEIELKMESLTFLYISESGIRELPSSIANLTGLAKVEADNCKNLTLGFGDTVNSQVLSSNTELHLLPNLTDFSLDGCNLSKSDFPLALDCWSKLTSLDVSGNNFVILRGCISKCVNLLTLNCSDCKSLLEIPEQVLPPTVAWANFNNCTSLEKIPKLSWVLLDNCTSLKKIPERPLRAGNADLSLMNCVRLRGYDITENIFLNHVSVSSRHFYIHLPGDEVPKWFSCRKEEVPVEKVFKCEFSFEIPPNLKWETLRLVLCVVNADANAAILVNGKYVNSGIFLYNLHQVEGRMVLGCIPLIDSSEVAEGRTWSLEQGIMCRVIFRYLPGPATRVKRACGVHLLGHQVADVSETSLGKRPRGSDFMALDDHRANVVNVGDHEAQRLTLSTGQADHPKRRHIDLNEHPELQSVPSEFHPVHLAEFNMPCGGIRRLEKLKKMPKLTSMNLSGCKFLEKNS